jgi:hypothetical protein
VVAQDSRSFYLGGSDLARATASKIPPGTERWKPDYSKFTGKQK